MTIHLATSTVASSQALIGAAEPAAAEKASVATERQLQEKYLEALVNDPRRSLTREQRERLLSVEKALLAGDIEPLVKFAKYFEENDREYREVSFALTADLQRLGLFSHATSFSGGEEWGNCLSVCKFSAEGNLTLDIDIKRQRVSPKAERIDVHSRIDNKDAAAAEVASKLAQEMALGINKELQSPEQEIRLPFSEPLYQKWAGEHSVDPAKKDDTVLGAIKEFSRRPHDAVTFGLPDQSVLTLESTERLTDKSPLVLRNEYGVYEGVLSPKADGSLEAYFNHGDKVYRFMPNGSIIRTGGLETIAWAEDGARYHAWFDESKRRLENPIVTGSLEQTGNGPSYQSPLGAKVTQLDRKTIKIEAEGNTFTFDLSKPPSLKVEGSGQSMTYADPKLTTYGFGSTLEFDFAPAEAGLTIEGPDRYLSVSGKNGRHHFLLRANGDVRYSIGSFFHNNPNYVTEPHIPACSREEQKQLMSQARKSLQESEQKSEEMKKTMEAIRELLLRSNENN